MNQPLEKRQPLNERDRKNLLENPGALCNMIRQIAVECGEILEKYQGDTADLQVDTKEDDSPVTLADRETEAYISMSLEQMFPDIPIIGEEASMLGRVPKNFHLAQYFWLVDPLDGTKDFIEGGDDFTVNIALIKDEQPVIGVIYAPARGELYAGHGPDTAIKWSEDTGKEKEISVRKVPKKGMTVVASRSHGDNTKLEKFLEDFKVEKTVQRASSLKLCVVAEGKADIYPRFGPTCEWDIAAGDAILRSAGGLLTDLEGNPMRYGGFNPGFINPEFVGCSYEWFDKEDKKEDE